MKYVNLLFLNLVFVLLISLRVDAFSEASLLLNFFLDFILFFCSNCAWRLDILIPVVSFCGLLFLNTRSIYSPLSFLQFCHFIVFALNWCLSILAVELLTLKRAFLELLFWLLSSFLRTPDFVVSLILIVIVEEAFWCPFVLRSIQGIPVFFSIQDPLLCFLSLERIVLLLYHFSYNFIHSERVEFTLMPDPLEW